MPWRSFAEALDDDECQFRPAVARPVEPCRSSPLDAIDVHGTQEPHLHPTPASGASAAYSPSRSRVEAAFKRLARFVDFGADRGELGRMLARSPALMISPTGEGCQIESYLAYAHRL